MLFNDGQGHDKGDEILATLGETIYRSIIDFKSHIYRYSDEFVIIVYNCDRPHAKALFTLIMDNIDSLKITSNHPDHPDTKNNPLIVKSTYRVLPHSKSGEIVNAVRAMQKELYEKIVL